MKDTGQRSTPDAASNSVFEATFKYANVGIAHVAVDGRWLRVNDTVCDMLGYSREVLLQLTFQDITHPEDLETDLALRKQLANGEIPSCRMQKRYLKPSGAVVWVDLQVASVTDDAGEVRYFVSTLLDITGNKEVEQRNMEMQRRLHYALDAGRLGEWSLDVVTGEAERTLRHDQIFGYDELLPTWTYHNMLQHIYHADRADVDNAFKTALNEGTDWNFEARILRTDGELRWIWERGSVTEFENGFPLRISGVIQDITERKHNEEANRLLAEIGDPLNTLADSESILERIASLAIPQLGNFCLIDFAEGAGKLRRIASAHCDADKQVDLHSIELAHTQPPASQLKRINQISDADLQRLTASEQSFNALRELGVRAFLSVPMLIRDRCIGVLTFFTNGSGRSYSIADAELAQRIAERVSVALENTQLYQTLRREDERKDLFLALLAHELRNPLGAISNGSELLRASCLDDHSQHTLDMINRQIQHLTLLLNDLMDVSRITRGKVELDVRDTSLAAVLDDAIKAMQAQIDSKQQHLHQRLEAGDIWLRADPSRLEQIVTNLLSNAIKFTPVKGTITLSTAVIGDELVMKVADTGAGIEADHLESIFDLFTQVEPPAATKNDGLGLGLTLVKELVELHGGSTKATSKGKNKGSEFCVRLPFVDSKPPSPAKLAKPKFSERTPALQFNILLVDDHEDAMLALAALLRLQDHQVRTVVSGGAALQAIQAQRPDLLLLDLGLPDISGYEVAQRVRANAENASVYIVALTGYGEPADLDQPLISSFDEYLVKPLNMAALDAIFERLQSQRQGATLL